MPRTRRTRKKRLLQALAAGLSVKAACEVAGIGRRTAYDWRNEDQEFASAWDEAIETGTDALEDEALSRAMNGSDTMLIFLLKARRPEKYRDTHRVQHDGGLRVEVVTCLPEPDEDAAD